MKTDEAMPKEQLFEEIESFIADRKLAKNASWPEVKIEEIHIINRLIQALLELKYERDVDGDLPIDWAIVDRTKYYHPFLAFSELKYPHKMMDTDELMSGLRDRSINLSIAEDELKKFTNYIEAIFREQKDNLKPLSDYLRERNVRQ